MNRGGIQQKLVPGGGKLRTIELTYDQRLLESEVTTADLTSQECVATTKRGNLSTTYSMDPTAGLKVEELFDLGDWIYACESNDLILAKHIQRMIDALWAKVATRLTTLAAALIGPWDSSVSPITTEGSKKYLTVNTLRTGSQDINPTAFEDIDFAIEQTSFCMPPIIFSGATLRKYYRVMQAGCCSNQGFNLEEIVANYGKAVLYDKRVQSAAGGAAYAWAVQPKALQPVYYTKNNDLKEEALARFTQQGGSTGSNYWKGVMQDPQSGMPFDITISDNCGEISVLLRLAVALKSMPADMFAPGDPMEGVKFVTGIKVVNN